jgi:MFS family permease
LLQSFNNKTAIPSSVVYKNFDLHYIPNSIVGKHPVAGNTIKNFTKDQTVRQITGHEYDVELENGSVGMLLAVKAFVQLFCNPIVGNLSGKFGYKNLIVFGTSNLLLAALSVLITFNFLWLFGDISVSDFSFFCWRILYDVVCCTCN